MRQLNEKEKVLEMQRIFRETKNEDNTILYPGDYLANQFDKLDGFDARWNSLITNKPLLFEDVDYVRVKHNIDEQITQEEIEAYKRGDLQELYATFENLLICNLQYYDRIMRFCTMIFLNNIRVDSDYTNEHLENVPIQLEVTPTKIWCCCFTNMKSTEWELNYAWGMNGFNPVVAPIEGSTSAPFVLAFDNLYKNITFQRFLQYTCFITGVDGYRASYVADKTSNQKLANVCSKFTKTSTAISNHQLDTISNYIEEADSINKRLYFALEKCLKVMFKGDSSQYAIYNFADEFYIHSSRFSLRVFKNNGNLVKEYLANNVECFIAEEYLVDSIKTQIAWINYKLPQHYDYDKIILENLLRNMLNQNYKEIICVKRMNDYGIVSKAYFTGMFAMVRINEEFMFDNRPIKRYEKVLSKKNAAKYLIDRGYTIFGTEKDVMSINQINKYNLIQHYSQYCVPVIKHMQDVIDAHIKSKNDIIDVVVAGTIDENRLNNKNIKYTNLKNANQKQLMAETLNKQIKKINNNQKSSYWKVVE